MQFFWVNIGETHNEVIEGSFLWAPKSSLNKNGTTIFRKHWDNVGEVRAGDVIFCCYKKQINFIATAIADAYDEKRPMSRSFKDWDAKGYRVDVSLTYLEMALHRDEISLDFSIQFDERTEPSVFTKERTLSQIYMARLPLDAGLFLLEKTQQLSNFQNALIDLGNTGPRSISKTTREALIQSRIGQGQFRRDVIKHWHGRCALTGLKNIDLLIASHIDAWALCNNDARLDPNNGLLLAAHIDKLFDRGLIAFTDAGDLCISKKLSDDDCKILGLEQYSKLTKITPDNRNYLLKHRLRFGFE